MLDQSFQENIKELFLKKKYQEIVSTIDKNFKSKTKPPGLSNLSGVCKVLIKNRTKNDVLSALKDFEDCYYNSNLIPQKTEALCNYITACVNNSKIFLEISNYFEKAKVLFEEYRDKIGYNEKLYMHGVDVYKQLLEHNNVDKLQNELIKKKTNSKIIASSYSFMKNYNYDWVQNDYFEYSKKLAKYFPTLKSKNIREIDFKKNKKIKVGFVAKDFAVNHSITYFLKDTLKYFDKNIFELYSFSLSSDNFLKASSLELKSNFDKWFDLSDSNNQGIINKIQEERIEILIDIMGLTHADRIEIFNTRCSPVQISWMAFLNTVGFPDIDYIIADKYLIKSDEEKLYSEKILKLSNIWSCHSGFKFKREYSHSPFKKNNSITFGSFNNYLKISDDVIKVWSTILRNTKNSKLLLKSSLNYNEKFISKKFSKYGVQDSLEFYNKNDFLELEDHIKLYKKIDLALDTFPYNGVTTTFEALWSGVPVLVMRGYNMNSRAGESILINGNIKHFIASNQDDYIKKAIYFGNNLEKLDQQRNQIFNNILKSPLFNSQKFSNDLQNKLLKIYDRKSQI